MMAPKSYVHSYMHIGAMRRYPHLFNDLRAVDVVEHECDKFFSDFDKGSLLFLFFSIE